MPFTALLQDIMNNGKDFGFTDYMPERPVKNALRSAGIPFWGRQHFSNEYGSGWMLTVPGKDAQAAYDAFKSAGIGCWYTPNGVVTDEVREPPGCPLVMALLAFGLTSVSGLTWMIINLVT